MKSKQICLGSKKKNEWNIWMFIDEKAFQLGG